MKHKIDHCQELNGLKYTIINQGYIQPVLNFFFEVFRKDEPINKEFGDHSHNRHAGR